jgi:general secretion pathway protein D
MCAVVLQILLPAAPCVAQAPAAAVDEETISLDFKDIELADLIQTFSKMTGKNFIYDETLRGKVTLISPRRVSLDEAYQVFLAVLNVKGFTVENGGSVNKVVQTRDAQLGTVYPLSSQEKEGAREQYVTRIVPLQYIDANVIATTVLKVLIPKSSIVAYPQTNTVIISDRAANVDRLVEILQKLDVPDANEAVEVIEMHYVAAEEMAQLVSQVINRPNSPVARRRGRPAASAATGPQEEMIIPFRPTNVIVVRASAEEMVQIRLIVARLDQKPSQTRAGIQVYYLENADAETLAKTMNEILTGIKSQESGTAAGTTAGAPRGGAAAVPQSASLGSVSITADKPTNSLIINSTPEEYETVRNIIRQLDIKRKQVYVEALILELSMDATKKLGTSLQGAIETSNDGAVFGRTGLNTDNLTVNADNPLASAISGIMLGGIFNPITFLGPDGTEITAPALSMLIDLSKTDTDVNILSAPRLLTSDNEEAEIIVGSNVPIITSRLTNAVGSASADSSGLATSVGIDRKDVALTLRFTPQITAGDLVRLNVYQEITNIADSNSNVGSPDQVGPSFTKRLIRNTVLAENGRTVVLGGLIDSNIQERITKVPILGDIPLLGWLFKSKTSSERKTNLLVFITPHIIKDSNDLTEVTNKAQQAMDQFQEEQGMSRQNTNKSLEQRFEMQLDESKGEGQK